MGVSFFWGGGGSKARKERRDKRERHGEMADGNAELFFWERTYVNSIVRGMVSVADMLRFIRGFY